MQVQRIQGSEVTTARKARQLARDITIILQNKRQNRFWLDDELVIVYGQSDLECDGEQDTRIGLKLYDVGPDCDGVQPSGILSDDLFKEFLEDSDKEWVLEIN